MSSVMEFWGHTADGVYNIANTKEGEDWRNIREFCKASEFLVHTPRIQLFPECPDFKNELVSVRHELDEIHNNFKPVHKPYDKFLGFEGLLGFVVSLNFRLHL